MGHRLFFLPQGGSIAVVRLVQDQCGEFYSWAIFKEELMARFGPQEMDRPFAAFSNLKQLTTIREYLKKFEQILGLLSKQPADYVMDKFVEGLKEDIRYEVMARKPGTFREALQII